MMTTKTVTSILIAGSRTLSEYMPIRNDILAYIHRHPDEEIVIITGRASSGPDDIAYHLARWDLGLKYREFKANWNKEGKRAGMLRNIEMLNVSDIVYAYWDGESSGTQHTIKTAQSRDMPTNVRISLPRERDRVEILTLDPSMV